MNRAELLQLADFEASRGSQIANAIADILGGRPEGFPVGYRPPTEPYTAPVPEPTDLKLLTVASLPALSASGTGTGTEVKFNGPGIIVPGPGAVSCYWTRSLQNRWATIQPGRPIVYDPDQAFLVARSTAGSIVAAGVLVLEFYSKPPKATWQQWYRQVKEWTAQSSDSGSGAMLQALGVGAPFGGTDVTLGTFSDSGSGPTQIFLAGSNMPVGGAAKQLQVVLYCPYTNTDEIYVGETAALAVASNNPLSATGSDTWSIPLAGKLFFAAASGTQKVSARCRSVA